MADAPKHRTRTDPLDSFEALNGEVLGSRSQPDPELRTREGDQVLPTHNNYPAIQDLVIQDLEARKTVGLRRYGTLLQPFNGRDALRDHYEALLDACNYARQLLYERDGK